MNTKSVCDALSVDQDSEILMLTKKGQAVRCKVTNIRETNRGSKGVKLIELNNKDTLVGVSEVVMLDEEDNTSTTEVTSQEAETVLDAK